MTLFKGDEPIPSDAIVLFDGTNLDAWQHGSGEASSWTIENGYAITRKADIYTKQLFTDCQLHVEFWLPLMAEATGQARSNSGVFFMGFSYEIQVLDSYGLESTAWDCGAMYLHPAAAHQRLSPAGAVADLRRSVPRAEIRRRRQEDR